MSVLIDTSIWSLALRRRRKDLNPTERGIVFRCRDLIIAGQASLIGPICQETLSGIGDPTVFERLNERLVRITELPLTLEICVLAAEFFNTCRRHGLTAEAVDMTICAAAHFHAVPIFTTDPDFARYAKRLPILLYGETLG